MINLQTLKIVDAAAKALERERSQKSYGWTDEEFEIWYNKDFEFVGRVKTWSDFTGTEKGKLFRDVKIILGVAQELINQ